MDVVAKELRDLWVGGRGLLLGLAFSVLLSVITYLVATNTALNFLEQRESVNLTLQVASPSVRCSHSSPPRTRSAASASAARSRASF